MAFLDADGGISFTIPGTVDLVPQDVAAGARANGPPQVEMAFGSGDRQPGGCGRWPGIIAVRGNNLDIVKIEGVFLAVIKPLYQPNLRQLVRVTSDIVGPFK